MIADHDVRRFLYVALPCAVAALAMIPAIFLGYVKVSIASAEGIEIGTSAGTADSLYVGMSTDRSVTAMAAEEDPRASTVIHLTRGRLDDLCLIPRFELPYTDLGFGLRLATSRAADIGEITLAADGTDLDGLELPETQFRLGGGQDRPEAVPAGPVSIRTEPGSESVVLTDVRMNTFGLVLDRGFMITSLRVWPGGGDLRCE